MSAAALQWVGSEAGDFEELWGLHTRISAFFFFGQVEGSFSLMPLS